MYIYSTSRDAILAVVSLHTRFSFVKGFRVIQTEHWPVFFVAEGPVNHFCFSVIRTEH